MVLSDPPPRLNPYAVLASVVQHQCHRDANLREAYREHGLPELLGRRKDGRGVDPLEVLAEALVTLTATPSGKFNGFGAPLTVIGSFLKQFDIEVDTMALLPELKRLYDAGAADMEGVLDLLTGHSRRPR